MIADNEIRKVCVCHGVLLQGKVHIGPQIIDPDLLRVLFRASRAFIEKDYVGLDAWLVENARGQAENGMEVCGIEQLFPHSLSRAALE